MQTLSLEADLSPHFTTICHFNMLKPKIKQVVKSGEKTEVLFHYFIFLTMLFLLLFLLLNPFFHPPLNRTPLHALLLLGFWVVTASRVGVVCYCCQFQVNGFYFHYSVLFLTHSNRAKILI